MSLKTEARDLQFEIARLQVGRGRKYPDALRERIMAFVDRAELDGFTLPAIGRMLGIPQHRFEYWREQAPTRSPSTAMVPIRIVDEPTTSPAPARLVVVSPSGVRVEGVTLDDAIRILAVLQ